MQIHFSPAIVNQLCVNLKKNDGTFMDLPILACPYMTCFEDIHGSKYYLQVIYFCSSLKYAQDRLRRKLNKKHLQLTVDGDLQVKIM